MQTGPWIAPWARKEVARARPDSLQPSLARSLASGVIHLGRFNMTLVRRAMLFCAVGLLAASAAMAGVPSASTSTQPVGPVVLVRTSSPTPDPFNAFSYTIRDATSNLVPGSVVILNFSGCTDARVCPTAAYASGITVNCAAKTMTGVTNATGQI